MLLHPTQISPGTSSRNFHNGISTTELPQRGSKRHAELPQCIQILSGGYRNFHNEKSGTFTTSCIVEVLLWKFLEPRYPSLSGKIFLSVVLKFEISKFTTGINGPICISFRDFYMMKNST
jgi:hypothetical protein